jgi:hypothetical protein
MRTDLVRVLAFVLACACYNPHIAEGGYACSTEHPDCPSGFSCIGGRCLSHAPDLAAQPGADLASPVATHRDLATPLVGDLAGVTDLAPMCLQAGSSCQKASDCCSMVCLPVLFIGPLECF